MNFDPPLIKATLLRRYKRFLADVQMPDGSELTVHCPNTGSMKNCILEGSPCYLSDSNNPKRKYRYSWELASAPGGGMAGINTGRANALVTEAIENDVVAELSGYESLRREQKYGGEGSRIDILLSRQSEQCFVEVKSVTLHMGDGAGQFPDAVSARASKHLRELMWVVEQGQRAVLFFCVQHTAIERVSPAEQIDPTYAKLLRAAVEAGVEVVAYGVSITEKTIVVDRKLPVVLW